MLLTALVTVVFSVNSLNDDLPSFLKISDSSFDQIWDKGLFDGVKRKTDPNTQKLSLRIIDRYWISLAEKAPCSWARFLHPRLLIRQISWDAGSQYWTDDEANQAKGNLRSRAKEEPKYLAFSIILNEMPSFYAAYGALSRHADPKNLTDVRCVLKVGDKVIQPSSQPGDLTVTRTDSVNEFTRPSMAYITGELRGNSTRTGNEGYLYTRSNTKVSYIVESMTSGSERYSTYKGEFIVLFPLRNDKGDLNILESDKEIKLLVIKKSAELSATYKLSDWVRAFEKK